MSGAIHVHLFNCRRRVIRGVVPIGGLTISVHSAFTTRERAGPDVIFYAAFVSQIGFSPIRKSTMRPIVSAVGEKLISGVVALTTATKLSEEEKLEVLRLLDQFREWHSLEEKRYCLVCGIIISGRQIQVEGGTRGNGPLRLSCPTERCNSIPMDWVLPTDEILARVEKLAAEERKAAELKPAAVITDNAKPLPTVKAHDDLVSRLIRFVSPFKRYS